ncbi:MAG: hypothetical protein ACREGL_11640, partial [Alphaproteobacteria bacterium]
GPFLVGPYQGSDRNTGYRLAYTPAAGNASETLELLRFTARGSSVVDQAKGPFGLEDSNAHAIEWTRTREGEMVVKLDDKELMRETDRGVRDPFGGLVLVNLGGDYAVRDIALHGAP